MNPFSICASPLISRQAVVVRAARLVGKVFQTVLLGSGLGVDIDFILHGDKS